MSVDLSHLSHLTIAVTGLATGDNPQPGVPIIRSIRSAGFTGRIVGLVYDALEAGVFVQDLADAVYQIPYPSLGRDVFLQRLDTIRSGERIDLIIPTLDSEIISFIRMKPDFDKRGIRCLTPEEDKHLKRDKSKLFKNFIDKGIQVPRTFFMTDATQAYTHNLPYPVFVKGHFYEAYRAANAQQVIQHFHYISGKWGLPVLVQEGIVGEEFNVAVLGDGTGEVLGMIPQRKIVITDKGKGFGGVVVDNPALNTFTRKVMHVLQWHGPAELEIMQAHDEQLYLIEINPRFPAWIRLAEGAGQNLPAMLVKLALGEEVKPFTQYKTGTIFIRHSEDIISNISVLGQMTTNGQIIRRPVS